jgi:hypothetical protein
MKIDLIKVLAIAVLATFGWTLVGVFGDQEYSGMAMNASISQPIDITLSGNYTAGIFFTNTTEIGTQYPITDMTVLNNATANYWTKMGADSNSTDYYVTSSASNTINITVWHCACTHLICQAGGDCAAGTDVLYVNDTADGGVGWANGTIANFETHAPASYFPDPDNYQVLGKVDAGDDLYMRYWVNPRPNSAPSGDYEGTFSIRAVEESTSVGACSC